MKTAQHRNVAQMSRVGRDQAATVVPAAVAAPVAVAAHPSAEVMDKWSRSCALCHVTGNAGAPRIGSMEEWAPRLAKGKDVLLQHTLEGFNDMPPLGYCMSCERDDFVAMIEFMGRDSVGERDSIGERDSVLREGSR
jgi:cytochrome c5